MKFHEYKTLWEEVWGRLPRHVTEEKFYSVAMAGGVWAGNGLVLAEGIWKQLHRPYYQVYPAIIPTLLNLRLDIQTSLIHTPMPALLVRLLADKPIDELPSVQTALMCQDGPGEDLRLWVNFMRPAGLANMHITLGCEPGKTLEQSFQESAANTQNYVVSGNFYSEEYLPMVLNSMRLCAMLCLLADDPDAITPDVLADDRQKYEASGDQKYVDRAHRHGKLGWNVGPADRGHAPLPSPAPGTGLDGSWPGSTADRHAQRQRTSGGAGAGAHGVCRGTCRRSQ